MGMRQVFVVLMLCSVAVVGEIAPIRVKLGRRREQAVQASGMVLRNRNLQEYYGRMQIGTPLVSFDVVFDTTLQWTWLPTDECTTCHNSRRYIPRDSRTAENLGEDKTFYYNSGDKAGTIRGHLYRDTISINKMTVTEQHLLAVYDASNMFSEFHSSGFIGLSPKHDPNNFSFMENLRRLNLIQKNVFAIKLSKVANDDKSEISFGGYNPDLVLDSFAFEKNYGQNQWLVNMQSMKFGDTTVDMHHPHAELNTAERNLRMIRSDFSKIEEALRKQFACKFNSEFLFFCYIEKESYDQFPPITIQLEKFLITLKPEDYVQFGLEIETGQKIATLLIEVYAKGVIEYTVLGTIVLRNYYILFDADSSLIGFSGVKTVTPTSSYGTFLGIFLPLLFLGLGFIAYMIYRRKRYGQFFGKTSFKRLQDEHVSPQLLPS